jgi:hypothetical protein
MQNTRQLYLQGSIRVFYQALFWIPVFAFSLLLVVNTVPYFSFSKEFSFIQERSFLFRKEIYKSSFYIHIFAGAICILTALIQFSRIILKKARAIHRWSGRMYVFVVIFLGSPTGLYLAFFAKGSFAERSLFLFMALVWFFTTLVGWTTIMKGNVLAHKNWMIRSYAMAMTAVTFRIYHLIFYVLDWNHLENYELSLWISVIGNMLLAEYVIFRRSRSYIRTFRN